MVSLALPITSVLSQQMYNQMAKILRKQKIFRFSESEYEMLEMAKKHHIKLSQFVREAIREKFSKDYPTWIEAQNQRNIDICPF